MSFKSDTPVDSRGGRLCRLSVLMYDVPHLLDGRNMIREYTAGVAAMLSVYPGVRMTGRIDVFRSDRQADALRRVYRYVENPEYLDFDSCCEFIMILFYMYCDSYSYAAAGVFAEAAVRAVYSNARLICKANVKKVYFDAADGMPELLCRPNGRQIYRSGVWWRMDAWERLSAAGVVYSAVNRCKCGKIMVDIVSGIYKTPTYYSIVEDYIRDVVIAQYDLQYRRYECFKMDVLGHCSIYVGCRLDSFGRVYEHSERLFVVYTHHTNYSTDSLEFVVDMYCEEESHDAAYKLRCLFNDHGQMAEAYVNKMFEIAKKGKRVEL